MMSLYSLQLRNAWLSKPLEVGVFSRKTIGRGRTRDGAGSLGTVIDTEHLFLVPFRWWALQMLEQAFPRPYACVPLWVPAPSS